GRPGIDRRGASSWRFAFTGRRAAQGRRDAARRGEGVSERIFIIGAGKVGRGLAFAFRSVGLQVLGVHARTPRDGATTSGEYPRVMSEANVIILAVSDSELNEACHNLAMVAREKRSPVTHGTIVLHTSGTVTPPAIEELRSAGSPSGTFHPLAPFSTAERGAAALHDGWVGIDGDPTACAAAAARGGDRRPDGEHSAEREGTVSCGGRDGVQFSGRACCACRSHSDPRGRRGTVGGTGSAAAHGRLGVQSRARLAAQRSHGTGSAW